MEGPGILGKGDDAAVFCGETCGYIQGSCAAGSFSVCECAYDVDMLQLPARIFAFFYGGLCKDLNEGDMEVRLVFFCSVIGDRDGLVIVVFSAGCEWGRG